MNYESEKKWEPCMSKHSEYSKKAPKDNTTIMQETDFVWWGNDPYYLEKIIKILW